MIDLAHVFTVLDEVRDRTGALVASTTFLTAHGLVGIVSGPDGRAMTVNGERVPLVDEVA